jgi:hypothetical protein
MYQTTAYNYSMYTQTQGYGVSQPPVPPAAPSPSVRGEQEEGEELQQLELEERSVTAEDIEVTRRADKSAGGDSSRISIGGPGGALDESSVLESAQKQQQQAAADNFDFDMPGICCCYNTFHHDSTTTVAEFTATLCCSQLSLHVLWKLTE